MILDLIEHENDIKKIPKEQLPLLAEEIREFLIENISSTGGHLASNLGAVELTMALHLSLELPKDKIIWDVGHQSYTHKILTGRRNEFDTLRKFGGLSGFPKTDESPCDTFNTGHSSTSISAGLGFVRARDLLGEDNKVVSVIGDGAMTGGMALEALNNAMELKKNFIIVLNDNEMSIAKNIGGVAMLLNNVRTQVSYEKLKNEVTENISKIPVYGDKMVGRIRNVKSSIKQLVLPESVFEDMGATYLGPIDGHDIEKLCKVFKIAKRVNNTVIVHVITKKGKGYPPAEHHPARFHGTGPFQIETGIPKFKKTKAHYTDVFSTVIRKLGERDDKIVAITAAMPDGCGLKRFANQFPERFFDVGIAEEHAVTFAAGLAMGGFKPVFAVYSSFLQRAYDQIIHDVCMQNLHVIFAIDRAGIVGSDGETHQGIFDLSYLSSIPNMTVMAPKNKWELSDMMKFAARFDGPIAVRYPRGEASDEFEEFRQRIEHGKSEMIFEEQDIALLAIGNMVPVAAKVRTKLIGLGYFCSLINARFAKPIDEKMILELTKTHKYVITLEENISSGGFGQHVREFVDNNCKGCKVMTVAIEDCFVQHGSPAELLHMLHMDEDSITDRIVEFVRNDE